MKSPEKAASGSGFGDDTGSCRLAVLGQPAAGGLPGDLLRFSPSFGTQAQDPGRCGFLPDRGMGLALYLLRTLPWGHPDGISAGDGKRNFAVGRELRPLASAGIFRILGFCRDSDRYFADSLEKFLENCKNFVCICGKMGYNRMYENLQITEKAEEGIPWQKKEPRPNK